MTCFRCGRREWALADRPVCGLCGWEADDEELSTVTLESRPFDEALSGDGESSPEAAGRDLRQRP
jgi:hypothetical protein